MFGNSAFRVTVRLRLWHAKPRPQRAESLGKPVRACRGITGNNDKFPAAAQGGDDAACKSGIVRLGVKVVDGRSRGST